MQYQNKQKLSNRIKSVIKKTVKFTSSRILYVLIGLFLSIAIVAVYAALPTVNSGDTLTSAAWNDLVNKVNELDNQVINGTITKQNCTLTGWLNSYDGLLDYNCPGNKVMSGVYSVHTNFFEDRIFRFYCCDLVLSP